MPRRRPVGIHTPTPPHPHTPTLLALLALLALAALAGCAQVPANLGVTHVQRQMIVDFTVAGKINPLYYYYIAIDTVGDAAIGPVPVVSAPWGNGWGTGRITHFVQYHLGVFTVYEFRPDTNMIVADPLGPPYQFEVPQANRIRVTLDMDTLGTNLDRINLNLITTDRIDIEPTFLGTKLYDALGSTGNRYLNLPVNVSQTFTNGQSLDPEQAGDLPPQPAPDVTVEDIDLTDWTVDVRRG